MSAFTLVDELIVTPYAGVWIEIRLHPIPVARDSVTPYAGVWIEIQSVIRYSISYESLPTRECGLKSLAYTVLFE